jgi:L-fucose isomerase-like protein
MSAQLAKVMGQVVLDRKEQLLRLGMSIEELPNLWLFQNVAGKPMDDSKLRKVFAKVLAKAGLAQRNLHFSRDTFASLLPSKGSPSSTSRSNSGTARLR